MKKLQQNLSFNNLKATVKFECKVSASFTGIQKTLNMKPEFNQKIKLDMNINKGEYGNHN